MEDGRGGVFEGKGDDSNGFIRWLPLQIMCQPDTHYFLTYKSYTQQQQKGYRRKEMYLGGS